MLANLKVNILLGLISFLFTYLFSIVNNTWQTSLFRALFGFFLFYLLGFVLRVILKKIGTKKQVTMNGKPFNEGDVSKEKEQRTTVENELESEPGFQAIPLSSLHKPGNASYIKK